MDVFEIITSVFDNQKEYINATDTQMETYGILLCFSGSADIKTIYNCLNQKLNELSNKFKVNLSTQVGISVCTDVKGYYRGFSTIFVHNSASYCVLLGYNPFGQKILRADVDKKITDMAVKKCGYKSYNNLIRRNNPEMLSKFDYFYNKFLREEKDDPYESNIKIKYPFDPKTDMERLGPYYNKGKIKDQIGNLTIIPPYDVPSTFGRNDIFLCADVGLDHYNKEFFIGLFQPFTHKLYINKKYCVVEFENYKKCYYLSYLYKTVKAGNETIIFSVKNNNILKN